jgi:cbb3-type cytochrome oxidase subunit 3
MFCLGILAGFLVGVIACAYWVETRPRWNKLGRDKFKYE